MTVHRNGYKRSRKVRCAHGWALRSWKLWTYHSSGGDRHRQRMESTLLEENYVRAHLYDIGHTKNIPLEYRGATFLQKLRAW